MRKSAEHFKAVAAFGIVFALVVSSLGADQTGSSVMFVFGCAYGGLWLQHG